MGAGFSLSEKGLTNTEGKSWTEPLTGALKAGLMCNIHLNIGRPEGMETCVWINTCISCLLRGSRSNEPTVAMNTPTSSWFINTPLKRTRLPRRNGWFQGWGGNSTSWAYMIPLCQEARKYSENHGNLSKGHGSQLEEALTGRI